MSTPLKKGEVRYLGYRSDLEACVFAVRSAKGTPPARLAELIAALEDVQEKTDMVATRLEAWAESHTRAAQAATIREVEDYHLTVSANYRELAGRLRDLLAVNDGART